ncbi:MAG TPA: hypothetical protein VMU78_09585 [Methylocella sp.]|nr:hypothetical protein [Methylocella sp.]
MNFIGIAGRPYVFDLTHYPEKSATFRDKGAGQKSGGRNLSSFPAPLPRRHPDSFDKGLYCATKGAGKACGFSHSKKDERTWREHRRERSRQERQEAKTG